MCQAPRQIARAEYALFTLELMRYEILLKKNVKRDFIEGSVGQHILGFY